MLAGVDLVLDIRGIPIGAVYRDQVESWPVLGIDAGVGPFRHPVGAHAPAESPHWVQHLLHHGLWAVAGLLALPERGAERTAVSRVQVLAVSLGRLQLGAADPELL